VETVLSFPEVEAALQHPHSIGSLEKNTLDELFARSAAVRSSQKFIEAIQFVSRLREYAPYNNMMVYLQRPNATFWATESHWGKKFNRQVKEDSIPIIMLQPKGPIMLVYDVADTVGPPLPARFREAFRVEGQFNESILALTLENCKREGIGVKGKHFGMLHAGTAIRRARFAPINIHIIVEINDQLGPEARYATLCHELAHIYLGHLGSDSEGSWPARLGLNRRQRELEAEAVAYMVCRRAGLATSSADYLAGYLSRTADLAGISVDMVTKVTGRIERMGRELIPLRRRQRQQSQSDLFGDQAQ
jgi:hypothetical protein